MTLGSPDLPKTSFSRPSTPPSAAPAQEGVAPSHSRAAASATSPAFSTSSTFDGSDDQVSSSPVLQSLPAPQLPGRAREYLRRVESPQFHSEPEDDDSQYVTASWGSPYLPDSQRHLHAQSFSSEPSDDSPIHQIAISTPFLRIAPPDSPTQQQQPQQGVSETASVLLNRARRPLRGITEDWIRAHTTNDLISENRHWLSDGDYSEHSSLSGSVSSEDAGWIDEADPRTPRASLFPHRQRQHSRLASHRHPRTRSSNETLKQAALDCINTTNMANLTVDVGANAQDAASIHTIDSAISDVASKVETPRFNHQRSLNGSLQLPATPTKPAKPATAQTPRLRKKVPWKGKNIMVHLPRDDHRGQAGRGSIPLTELQMEDMLRSWDELGYNIRGFDLEPQVDISNALLDPLEHYSQSRNQWPNPEQINRERSQRKYAVLLPDLNAWKDYATDVQEAKLRALGVSYGDEELAQQPSISPIPPILSRRMSMQYPPSPFSPPVPTGSAASGGQQGFPFPGAFHGTSATQSPTVPSVASPLSFNGLPGKFNSRASISISPHELPFHFGQPSPHGFSPRDMLLQQQLGRNGSPSILNLNPLVSPMSPFHHDGMPSPLGSHQRHQSLQYPMLPHQHLQRQESARASPRLQDLREVDEETQSNPSENKSPSKTPEPSQFIKHNASDSLQREIDDAEYHLEEQFREQLEHEDYSPHQDNEKINGHEAVNPAEVPLPSHARGPSVHFGNFGNDSDEGPVLHHPRPNSRGHSLTQKPFFDTDEARDSMDDPDTDQRQTADEQKGDEAHEIETTPSNLGTPVSGFGISHKSHQHPAASSTSNPWADVQSLNNDNPLSRRSSHASKPSLSKLNVNAREFKFNPTSTFTPGQFNFGASSFQPGSSTFQPNAFQASTIVPNHAQSTTSSHFSVPSTSSSKGRINAAAPVFSPGQGKFQFPSTSDFSLPGKSDFNFSASIPKFRPDAPTFQPTKSFTASVTSAAFSGTESADNRPGSIFGNIDLKLSSEITPSDSKTKAVPILRPTSRRKSSTPGPVSVPVEETNKDGRLTDLSRRGKKFRDNADDGNDVPLFADPTLKLEPLAAMQSSTSARDEPAAEKNLQEEDDEENEAVGDTTLDSTVMSESTDAKLQSESHDTKATTSPSATSPDQEQASWAPFEFRNEYEVQEFDNARPFGDFDPFQTGHKKSMSANAKSFAPGGFTFGGPKPMAAAFEPSFMAQPPQMVEAEETEDDRAASPTPGPEPQGAVDPETTPIISHRELTPEPVRAPQAARSGLAGSRFASAEPRQGLGASRFAALSSETKDPESSRFVISPSAVADADASEEEARVVQEPSELQSFSKSIASPAGPSLVIAREQDGRTIQADHELTFEEIDALMRHMNETDPTMGVNKTVESSPSKSLASPVRTVTLARVADASPLRLLPQSHPRSAAPSPSPPQARPLPEDPAPRSEDPFVDPPRSTASQSFEIEGRVHHLGSGHATESEEWDKAFSDDEQYKLEQRAQYFNGHVQDLVGDMLADRLDPLEKTLGSIQHALLAMSRRTPSSRRTHRSGSVEIEESDADDEDDDSPIARKSASPQRNKKMEQMRFAVLEALNQHHASRALQSVMEQSEPLPTIDNMSLLMEIQQMREQLSQPARPDFSVEDVRHVVEEAIQNGRPTTPPPVVKDDNDATQKMAEMQAIIHELEQRLRVKEELVDSETGSRRAAEDRSAELRRQLEQAETKIEVEIMNRSVYDQRVHDLEERLRHQEQKTDFELHSRREAEDRLSEVQRLLRISSEEEDRLRAVLDERDQQIKFVEQGAGKSAMRLALLEAAQSNADKSQIDLTNRLNANDEELRTARQEGLHWRSEAEHARETTRRQTDDFVTAVDEAKHLRKVIDTLSTQLTETEKIRETWRVKFVSMQDDMAHAAREINEENSRRLKKEQALIARHEVLDARLQAESKTRERLEAELERLEGGERAGMRAVAECKRLEGLLAELRTENHKIQTTALHFQREAKEARESAATEVQRTRIAVQADLDTANEQVNLARVQLEEDVNKVRAELADALMANESLKQQHELIFEDEVAKFRGQIDQVRMDAETAKAHHDMMLEEAQTTSASHLEAVTCKHQSDIDDIQTRYERELANKMEDAQRTESNLLERLSLSSSKVEHLQDRVTHLEDKVQIAQEAAKAAIQAAKAVGSSEYAAQASTAVKPIAVAVAQAMQVPEKISPQALRESIMVLQEQLQAREQRIEELEHTVSELDPEADIKILKRDDEITWLRELLAVRHGDLQDIIAALSAENFDLESVRDAAIRLKANLQMEEQERERALNGGSAISLPDIAAAIKGAATPRVAQAVGPLAAAWGNWRKGNQPALNNLSNMLSSPAAGRNQTPSRSRPSTATQNSFLSGLMTPPATNIRNTPPAEHSRPQPTAFGNTGRRFTAEQFANRTRGESLTARQAEKMPMPGTPPRRVANQGTPVTPPMARSNGYDADASHIEDFDDAGFFDD